jgi:hypothetical protein
VGQWFHGIEKEEEEEEEKKKKHYFGQSTSHYRNEQGPEAFNTRDSILLPD